MKRLIVAATTAAVLAGGLTAAPVANADANDDAFIAATDQIFPGVGYADVPPNVRIAAAHTACALMDEGVGGAEISDALVALLGPREHAGYFAAWFEQIAVTTYCPRHSDKLGVI